MMSEKADLSNLYEPHPRAPRRRFHKIHIVTAFFLLPASLLLLWLYTSSGRPLSLPNGARYMGHHVSHDQCAQVPPLVPQHANKHLSAMDEYLKSKQFRNKSITRLSGAVRIPTMSFDDMGSIGEDKRWDIFYDFASYLKEIFPLTHRALYLDTVNTHGLVYTWKGSNPALKPTLLMAHQDVVPVPKSTIDSWTHPPFEGVYDGKFIWGRGSSDCKNSLIAILESVELLLAAGFKPQRTVILSFGFDEEISGVEGAGHLALYLMVQYGKDSMAAIVDEGAGISSMWGTTFAQPGVAEKGAIDVEIVVRMPGGHSSIPPPHTGIGVMSDLIALIEANPYEPRLNDGNPYTSLLFCGAAHGPEFPSKLKKLLPSHSNKRTAKKDKLAIEAAKAGPATKYLMTTSLAVDVIEGGVKTNALPERTSAIVNHRINVGEHVFTTKLKIARLTESIADKYNLTFHAFDNSKETPSSITLIAGRQLDPAPITPTTITPLSAYAVLSGTTRALYGEDVQVAPGIMTGNTDTRYYWDLSRNIFRYAPGWDSEEEGLGRIHTVDERVSVKAHISTTQWYSLFIRNMDEADLR